MYYTWKFNIIMFAQYIKLYRAVYLMTGILFERVYNCIYG